MSKTVFITGASSGIGKASAKLFQTKGWNVVATMRSPGHETELNTLDNVLVTRLDVTDDITINAALKIALDRFGKIDVVVNNAGYGLWGPFEAASPGQVRRQFDTNVLGLMAVTRALLPHFRENGAGTFVNIASVGGKLTFPMVSCYHGTKFAVEGFSESLSYELADIGLRVKIIEPGVIGTDFQGRSLDSANKDGLTAYDGTLSKFNAALESMNQASSPPELVAEIIFEASNDGSLRLRYPAGADAEAMIAQRAQVGDEAFVAGLREQLLGN